MIHKTAIIDPKAKISSNITIGAYSVIGPDVEIDENTIIHSHVNISGHTKIGKENKIFPFASIGSDPQDLKYNGEETRLIIGDKNTIREYVTINPGTKGGGGKTLIGDNCLFMISSHVAHDCLVGNNVIIANNVPLGGHATIEDNVVIGGNSAVQQFTRIGRLAMIGGMTGVLKDVAPFGLSIGNIEKYNTISDKLSHFNFSLGKFVKFAIRELSKKYVPQLLPNPMAFNCFLSIFAFCNASCTTGTIFC